MRAGFGRILGSSASVRDKVSFSYAVRNVLTVFAASLAVEKNTSLDALNCPYVFFSSLDLQSLHCTHTAAAMGGFCPQKDVRSPDCMSRIQIAICVGTRRIRHDGGPDRCTQTKVNVCLTLDRLCAVGSI